MHSSCIFSELASLMNFGVMLTSSSEKVKLLRGAQFGTKIIEKMMQYSVWGWTLGDIVQDVSRRPSGRESCQWNATAYTEILSLDSNKTGSISGPRNTIMEISHKVCIFVYDYTTIDVPGFRCFHLCSTQTLKQRWWILWTRWKLTQFSNYTSLRGPLSLA